MNYRLSFIIITLVMSMFSCKTTKDSQRETLKQNMIYKKLVTEAQALQNSTITGQLQISGNKNIPAVFIAFKAKLDSSNQRSLLSLSVLSKPLIDLYLIDDTMTLVNHTEQTFFILDEQVIDFSPILGFNFNPMELFYFLQGKMFYQENTQLIKVEDIKNGYLVQTTNTNSSYEISTNLEGTIVGAVISNQFYDPLRIDIISFSNNEEGGIQPQRIKIKADNSTASMTCIIRSIAEDSENLSHFINPGNYREVDSIEQIEIKLK